MLFSAMFNRDFHVRWKLDKDSLHHNNLYGAFLHLSAQDKRHKTQGSHMSGWKKTSNWFSHSAWQSSQSQPFPQSLNCVCVGICVRDCIRTWTHHQPSARTYSSGPHSRVLSTSSPRPVGLKPGVGVLGFPPVCHGAGPWASLPSALMWTGLPNGWIRVAPQYRSYTANCVGQWATISSQEWLTQTCIYQKFVFPGFRFFYFISTVYTLKELTHEIFSDKIKWIQ